MKLKFGDLIKVTWVDACSTSGWRKPYRDGYEITDVGVFVLKNKNGLSMARGVEMGDREQVLTPNFIPKGLIRKTRKLR